MAQTTQADKKVPTRVLVVTSFSTLVVNALTSSVGVLLPVMSRDTGSSIQFLQWGIIGYSLASASVIITAGSLADIFGRRRIFFLGTILYAVASFIIAIGGHGATIVAGRCLQGLGAAAIMSGGLGILTVAGTGTSRLRAVTIWSAAAAIGGAIGPLVGGVFGQTTGWQGMFWTIGVLAAISAVMTRVWIQESKSATAPHKVDYLGTVLLAIGLSTLTLSVSQGGVWGWTSLATIGTLLISIVSGLVFVQVERTVKAPVLDLSLLRNKILVIASIALFISSGVVNALAYLLSIYMQSPFTHGLTALQAGLITLPATIAMVLTAAVLGGLVKKYGMRTVLTGGFAITAVAAGGLAFAHHSWGVASFALIFMVIGIGAGMTNGPAASISTSAVSEDQVGAASGVSNMARYLAAAIGIALTTSIYSAAATRHVDTTLAQNNITGSSATQITNQLLASGDQAMAAVQTAAGSASDQVVKAMQEALPIGMSRVGIVWALIALAGACMTGLAGRNAAKRRDGLESATSAGGTVHTIPDLGTDTADTVIDVRDASSSSDKTAVTQSADDTTHIDH